MRKIVSWCLVFFVMMGLMMSHAEAKRFGGGRSFGVQRSITQATHSQPVQSLAQRATGHRWLGPIAGLITGGLLASLLMGHGIGSGILSWLAIAVVGMLLLSFIRSRWQPSMPNQFNQQAMQMPPPMNSTYESPSVTSTFKPVGFDDMVFLRDVKVQFVRLQAAYDQKDLNDLRQFTTPQVFGEIQLQLHERGEAANHTEVVSLNAELLQVSPDAKEASVTFSGTIRETANAPAEPFKEIWHFQKDDIKSQWVVAGIQQA